METLDIFLIILGCIISYLLGGVSIARLMTKRENGGIDSQGSGNPGTMNMLRTHGVIRGLFTLLCDALKGVLPALFGLLYFAKLGETTSYVLLYLFGFCAVIGHIFPIYYKFKGGKGIATTFGVFMVADPITAIILFGIMFLTLFVIKIGSVVSLLFIIITAIVQLFKSYAEGNWIMIVVMWLMVLLDVWAHRINILRLMDNKENAADLQAGFDKDIERIKNKKAKKLEKNELKQEKIEQKYAQKIEKRNVQLNKKIEKLNNSQSEVDKN